MPLLRAELPLRICDSGSTPPAGIPVVVVVGGGALIDHAKLWRLTSSGTTRLIAVPSLWGSGADSSPVAVFERDGKKVAELDQRLLPDARSVWPTLTAHVPAAAARHGWGDVWSHALEGFLSPLATDKLRGQMAVFIRDQLLPTPLQPLAQWFDLAAEACWFQSQSGVGLVHGVAHELEPQARETLGSDFGHAHLCSIMLWPVMRFNLSRGDKVGHLFEAHGLGWSDIDARIRELHDPQAFARLLPLIESRWTSILRHPLTRTNGVLVRPDALQYFRDKAYELAS